MPMGIGEAAFRALADATEDCVFLADRQGRYLAVNRGFARWVGLSENEIIGRTGSDLWPSFFSEGEAPGHLLALNGERVEREELRPRRRDADGAHGAHAGAGRPRRRLRRPRRLPRCDGGGGPRGRPPPIRAAGACRPAGRRRRARLQQPADGGHRPPGAAARRVPGGRPPPGVAGSRRESGDPGGRAEPEPARLPAQGAARPGAGRFERRRRTDHLPAAADHRPAHPGPGPPPAVAAAPGRGSHAARPTAAQPVPERARRHAARRAVVGGDGRGSRRCEPPPPAPPPPDGYVRPPARGGHRRGHAAGRAGAACSSRPSRPSRRAAATAWG